MIVLSVVNFSLIYGTNERECGTMEIRIYKDFDGLSNCTVILGNLALVIPPFFDPPEYSSDEINNRTFPLR